jgi:hypothetical protein
MTAFGPRLSRKKANLLPLNPIAMRPLQKIGLDLFLTILFTTDLMIAGLHITKPVHPLL